MNKEIKIAVVGNCAAGKTTLVKGLKQEGYINAYNVPQEHSVVLKFWQRYNPKLLIYLTCSLEEAKKRRPRIAWGQERLEDQKKKLQNAYENKDLLIDTNNLSIDDVLKIAIEYIQERAE
ncbi:hypothetical protein HYG86_13705 [Alkalicella caledoniensis]|uniref:Uncharacterized protein n=1 Tax=Alkalicella caledoniensis TaxID=2731377 RepID=A0A7G9WAN0_ALKCA|nr:hypothetical protein [Alkalicella caledoniensis]QNO15742.1 hypothetical protein HYG86_13705 [Alkalicella caledoniensis]